MAVVTKKMAYKFKSLSGGDEHQDRVERCFATAFHKGYSVVETARIAGMKSAKYIHAALVKHGVISSAKPGRQSIKIKLPEALDVQLKIRGLSFAQWCAGWSFGLQEAAEGVNSLDGPVGTAIKRDFPGYYSKVTGTAVDDYETGPGFEHQDFVAHCGWDGAEGVFTIEIKDMGIKACGDNLNHAFYLARIQRKDLLAMARLEQMPSLVSGGEGDFNDW